MTEADILVLSCVCVSGAAHDGSAYSGNHRMDSAGLLPHEARTTQWQCCLLHKCSPQSSCFRCLAQCEGLPLCQHIPLASAYCRDPFRVSGPAKHAAPVQWPALHLLVFLKNHLGENHAVGNNIHWISNQIAQYTQHYSQAISILSASETARRHWAPPTPSCLCPLSGYWHQPSRACQEVGQSEASPQVEVQMTFII